MSIKHSVSNCLTALVAGILLPLAASAADTPPNVVFIIADDMAARLACYGDTTVSTLRLDELAREGVRFTNAFSQGAVCTPSRRSFLSGLSTKTVMADGGTNYFNTHRDTMTMGRLFRQHGYQTISVGKVDHGDGITWVDDAGGNQGEPPRTFWINFFSSGKNSLATGAALSVTVNGVVSTFSAGASLTSILEVVNSNQSLYRISPNLGGPHIEHLGTRAGPGFNFRLTQPGKPAYNLKYTEATDYQDRKAWDVHPMLPPGLGSKTLALFRHPSRSDVSMFIYTFNDDTGVLEDTQRSQQFIDFLASDRIPGKPFFAAVGFHNTHGPLEAHQRLHDKYYNNPALPFEIVPAGATPVSQFGFSWFPDWNLSQDQARRHVSAYYAALEELDSNVGRVIDSLKAKGIYDDTIIVFTSDQGYHLGYHGQWNKHTVYPEVSHVPLIVRYPKKVARGGVATGTVELLDIFPTLVELAQPGANDGNPVTLTDLVSAPGRSNGGTDMVSKGFTTRLDGRSFARQLADPGVAPGKPAGFIEWQTAITGVWNRAAYTEQYCYVEHYGTDERELYDRVEDPKGYVNLLVAETPSPANQQEAELIKQKADRIQQEANRLQGLLHAYFPLPVKPPVNQAPTAAPVSGTTSVGVPVNLVLSGTDPDGAIKSFVPANPALVMTDSITYNASTKVFSQSARYTPGPGVVGTVNSTYTTFDNFDKASAPATVTIIVSSQQSNVAPVANPQSLAMTTDSTLVLTLTGSDSDGTIARYDHGTPAHGTLSGTGAALVYTPAAGYAGADAFTFTVTDNRGATSVLATVSITVIAKTVDRSLLIYGSGNSGEGPQAPWLVSGAVTSIEAASRDYAHSGSTAIKATLGATGELGLPCSGTLSQGFTVNPYKSVSFWLNGGALGGQTIALAVNRLPSAGLQARYTLPGTLQANVWKQFTIKLADLGAPITITDLRAFRFYDQSGVTPTRSFYLDDVQLLSNRTPVAAAVAAQTAMVGEDFALTVPACSDSDGDLLTYTAIGLPSGLVFDPVTRRISGRPRSAGTVVATVTATDGDQASAAITISFTVLGGGVVVYGQGPVVEGSQAPWLVSTNIPASSTTAGVDKASREFAHTGLTSIRALLGPTDECGLPSSGVSTQGFSTAPYAAVSLWINGGAIGGQKVAMAVNRLLPVGLQAKKVLAESLPANTWRRIVMPLSDLGADQVTDFRAFRFYNQTLGGTSQPFFIDDVMLLDAAQANYLLRMNSSG